MASRIKGITVEIGGSTTGLEKALSGVNKKIKTTQSELRDVEKLLKLDPNNTVLLKQKQELLARSVEETKDKLESLKKANEQAAESVQNYDAWKAAYDPIQQEISDTKSRLAELKEAQKEAFDNHGADSDEYRNLQEEISQTVNELEQLRQQAKDVSEEFGNPISNSQYNALQREIIATEIELRQLESAAENTESAIEGINGDSLGDVAGAADEAEEQLEQAGRAASDFGDYLKAGALIEGAKGIVSGLKDIAEESKEYMKIMGSLEVSSEKAGYSAQQTSETYKKLYGVLADEQAAATTVANLQALGLAQDDLSKLTDAAIGAWAAYGDSIPIDGLAEAINETMRTGQVTGALADVLNWGTEEGENFGLMLQENIEFTELSSNELKRLTDSEKEEYEARKAQFEIIEAYNTSLTEAVTAEDKFNIALQNAGTEAERVNLIIQALNNQGLSESGKAWQENNQALVENNRANAELQEQLTQLGETVMPVITQITEKVALALENFNSLDEGTQSFILSAIVLVAVLGPVLSAIVGIISGISGLSGAFGIITGTVLPALQAGFSSVIGFISSHLISTLLIGAVTALVVFIATKGDEIQEILQNIDDFLQSVFAVDWTLIFGSELGGPLNAFVGFVKDMWDSIKLILDGIIDFIRGVFTGDWERAWNGIVEILSGIFSGIGAAIKGMVNTMIGLLNGAIAGVNTLIDGFNSIGFDMPDWLGGGSWHPNIPSIPNIPYLAEGGILKGSAVVGEAGPEILTVTGNQAVVQPLTGSATAGKGLSELTELLVTYLPYLAKTQEIYLDSGMLVGELTPGINEELGKIANRERNR